MTTSKRIVILKYITLCIIFCTFFSSPVYAALPASTNYKLQEFSFGSGVNNATSTNFKLNGVAGEVEFGRPSSTNFKAGTGLIFMQTSNVPPAPTLTNPASYYNKLKIILATGSNSTDAQYAIAVSPDNFATTTQYVQADATLGTTPVWQTYTNWGAATGTIIIGLNPNTTYTVKVKSRQGNFTESGFGPTAQAATVGSTLSFSLSTNAINIGQLTPGTVVTGATQVTSTISTNGSNGGAIYVYGSNGGLKSTSVNYTISTVSSDLSATAEGYGLRAVSTTQTTGGPMEAITPYNGVSNNVGVLDTSKRPLFDSTNQPVTSGQGIFELKAKASATTKAATDYADVITVIASATF